jgi:hypothetical protein
MVFKSSGEETDLVTGDYYAQELRYQEKIDQEKNAQALGGKLRYELKNEQLLVYFPADFKSKTIAGKVTVYCPADKSKDVVKTFVTGDAPVSVNIPAGSISMYELQVNCKVDGRDYYFSERIFR